MENLTFITAEFNFNNSSKNDENYACIDFILNFHDGGRISSSMIYSVLEDKLMMYQIAKDDLRYKIMFNDCLKFTSNCNKTIIIIDDMYVSTPINAIVRNWWNNIDDRKKELEKLKVEAAL